ncbi:Crp/Fnr family transcriptional regulator [Paenarthrobacter nitroguajacolicus]|uniref:Crp/Fnr family transcriptional regulator n=1 Tax=Paenarthrobacter nitroguajacolicus TaxID=211146 RepID=UPI003D23EF8D
MSSGLNPASCEAWANSYFAPLPIEVRNVMLRDAFVVTVQAGRMINGPYSPPRLFLLHSGQARVAAVSKEGRAATVRYTGPGQVLGLPAAIYDSSPIAAYAITDCEMSMLNVNHLRRLAQNDPKVAWLLLQQTCAIIYETVEILADTIFGTVEQRVSRHLLDLASNSEDGLIVNVEQQELADAIGSVREVVARALRKLREAGLVERHGRGLRIVNPSALHHIASGVATAPGA